MASTAGRNTSLHTTPDRAILPGSLGCAPPRISRWECAAGAHRFHSPFFSSRAVVVCPHFARDSRGFEFSGASGCPWRIRWTCPWSRPPRRTRRSWRRRACRRRRPARGPPPPRPRSTATSPCPSRTRLRSRARWPSRSSRVRARALPPPPASRFVLFAHALRRAAPETERALCVCRPLLSLERRTPRARRPSSHRLWRQRQPGGGPRDVGGLLPPRARAAMRCPRPPSS